MTDSLSRHLRHRKPPRPPDLCGFSSSLTSLVALFTLICLALFPSTNAQSSSSSSSPLSSTSSSTTASPSGTTSQTLATLPTTLSLTLTPSIPSLSLLIPSTSPSTLYLTANICSLSSNTSLLPSLLLSTSSPPAFALGTRTSSDRASGGVTTPNRRARAGGVWSISWDKGFGNWTGTAAAEIGLLLGVGVDSAGNVVGAEGWDGNITVQLGVSTDGPLHALSAALPYLGDTTSSSALLFSPLLLASPLPQLSYPNYTLPPPAVSFPQSPFALSPSSPTNTTLSSNLSLVLLPTEAAPSNAGLDNSRCAVMAANATAGVSGAASELVREMRWVSVGGEEGFRAMWVVGGLESGGGNYTAWVVDDKGGMSGPIWLATKEASFPCPLALPTAMCPSLAYAAPLPLNGTLPVRSLPSALDALLTSSLTALTSSLQTLACGRDLYSHVSSCADCLSAYRDWLCRVLLPRCTSPASSPNSSSYPLDWPSPKRVFRTDATPRNSLWVPEYDYTELLPCLSTCHAVDRRCPVWLGFRCPRADVMSWEEAGEVDYGYVSDQEADAIEERGGSEGKEGDDGAGVWASEDRWGNRWCSG